MHTPTAEMLDCCEEAFLFDLAREDVWLYTNTTSSGDGGTTEPVDAPSPTSSPTTPTPFSSYEAAQHRRVAAVEWSTLRVLLRHALRSGAAFDNDHEVDNYIVTSLLEAKPLTASAVVAARERFVGKRVTTRDLVRMVSRAGPLQPSARDNLKRVFHQLLKVEKAMASVVQAERDGRKVMVKVAAAAWRALVAASQRTQQLWKYEGMLREQQATQQRVVDVHLRTLLDKQTLCASRAEIVTEEMKEDAASRPSLVTESADEEKDKEQQLYLDHVVGGQLHQSHAELSLVQSALHAATATIESSSWGRDPLHHAIHAYTHRLDQRIASVGEKVMAARASVNKLRRMRAGRQLLANLAQHRPQPDVELLTADDFTDASLALPSVSEALLALTLHAQTVGGASNSHLDERRVQKVVWCLFASIVGLGNGAALSDRDVNSLSQIQCTQDDTSEKRSVHAAAAIEFPFFDYFAEFCDVYTASADVDTRWFLFTSYADAVQFDGASRATNGTCHSAPWFSTCHLHLRGFYRFLLDWALCADAPCDATSNAEKLSLLLSEAVLPRWLTAPIFDRKD